MRIRPVKRHGRGGETMFAFEFRDEEDLTWLSALEDLAAYMIQDEGCKERLFEYIRTLRSRCDDKYARDDVAMSSVLFAGEMADFTFELLCGFVNVYIIHTDRTVVKHYFPFFTVGITRRASKMTSDIRTSPKKLSSSTEKKPSSFHFHLHCAVSVVPISAAGQSFFTFFST